MIITPAASFPEIRIVVPTRHVDARGSFSEVWREDTLRQAGVSATFVQENHVVSHAVGTLRGLHFQIGAAAQAKLIWCVRGRILDVAVDIRAGSPTFGRAFHRELDAAEGVQVYLPVGFAHGYCTLEPHTEVIYKVTAPYDPRAERGFRWDDPQAAIAWPFSADSLVISERDAHLPALAELPTCFTWAALP